MREDFAAWLALKATKGVGPGAVSRLILRFGSPQAVQAASVGDLMAHEGLSLPAAQRMTQRPDDQTLLAIEREVKAIEQGAFSVITILDAEYPLRLKTISDPPPFLYLTGQLDEVDHQAIAVVGSRKATPAGLAFTRMLSQELASVGFTIVSGLARGVDQAAHQGALTCSTGRTVAVLGCGIDRTYPPEHKSLRECIEQHGAVLSEFSPGAVPHGYHFPQRNRVISGMSVGVVVTEATEKSGSLITARLALEQNREVFAVPGTVSNETSRGPHHLIKQGAKLVEGLEDILEELLPQLEGSFRERLNAREDRSCEPMPFLDKQEEALYNRISFEPISLEELLSQAGCSPSDVMSVLLSLEMKGVIRQLAGSQYIRTSIR
ncbi:DNA-processing protein DprA [Candidatus Nitrospira salsa]|nr:MAG: DNA polymerase [Nitrospirales bacterium]